MKRIPTGWLGQRLCDAPEYETSVDKMAAKPESPKRPPFWPLTRGKTLDLFLGFLPGWIALIGAAVASLLPLIQSCRNAALE
jgi:hypothetical protein